MPAPVLPTAPDDLGFLISDVGRLNRRAFAQRMQGGALTFAQARALLHVARGEGLRQVELASLMEVRPMTLARLIDQLDARGLVERRADPRDGRAVRLYLTAAAEPHVETIRSVAQGVRGIALRGIDAAHARALVATLVEMRENLLRGEGSGAPAPARRPSTR